MRTSAKHILSSGRRDQSGFTLLELIVVVALMGILAAVAIRPAQQLFNQARTDETMQEMNALVFAIVGNPELENNGVRSDFGYVGDVGAMPPDLDALHSNPGSYSTWKGPYIEDPFSQTPGEFKKDAWGDDYVFLDTTIKSVGKTVGGGGCGGPTTIGDIIRRVTFSVDELLYNSVSGNVFDFDGTPPGTDYDDSVDVRLIIPNGSGGMTTRTTTVDDGGFFTFDSIPIGNHSLIIIYEPDNDTLERFVSVLPASNLYSAYHLAGDLWFAN